MKSLKSVLSFDRDEISEGGRELFLKDLKKIAEEYFDGTENSSLEVTRTDEGFLVCVLFTARRIKNVKKPQ